jgi:hypothetical protein
MLGTAVFLILIGLGWDIFASIVFQYSTPYENSRVYTGDFYSLYAIIVSVPVYIILTGLYIYPVVGLISEIKNGIMSRETYPREGK